MHHNASEKDVNSVKKIIEGMRFKAVPIPGAENTAIGVIGKKMGY
jgi:hypothetical protein